MNRYNVLLVDDEEIVFDIMMRKVNWEAMGFHVAGYARNGLEALELAEELRPDVVMSDIKMPYMDGLTLCKQLKELYPNIRVIIFSGFDEFEYAKEAIQLQAEEYILKPIDSGEVQEVFERVRRSLDKEIDEKRNVDKLQEYYLSSLPILQDNFYISLIEGRIEEKKISKYISDYQIHLQGPYYVASVVHISYREKNGEEVDVAPFLLSLSVQQLIDEQLKDNWESKTISYLGDIVVISAMRDPGDRIRYTNFMQQICKLGERICKNAVSIGIGMEVANPSEIRASYLEAKNALSYRILYGNGSAISIHDVEEHRRKTGMGSVSSARSEKILSAIKLGNVEELRTAVEAFCEGLYHEPVSMKEYRVQLMKLTADFMEFMEEHELEEPAKDAQQDMLERLYSMESPDEVQRYLQERSRSLLLLMEEKRSNTRARFVSQTEEYVKEHYRDEGLCVDTICQYLNLSSSYFSTVFKKETGKTFINYLTDYRMEQAERLLQTSEMKTYEIADRIGYSDPNYFSYVFKKKFGVSPSKYRSK